MTSSTDTLQSQAGQILERLAVDPWLHKTTKNIAKGSGLHEDLKAELFLILGQKEPAYIIKAHENKYLQWMVVRILQTMFHSPRHPFFLKYRHQDPTVPISSSLDIDDMEDRALQVPDPQPDIDEAIEYHRREQALHAAEKEADMITRAIWNRYRHSNSAQEVARYFDVPYSYIRVQLKTFRERILEIYHQLPPI